MADLRQSLGQSIVLAAPGRLYACWREKHRALTWWRSHHGLSGLMVACMLDSFLGGDDAEERRRTVVRIIKWLGVDFQGVATPPLASLREARRVHQPI